MSGQNAEEELKKQRRRRERGGSVQRLERPYGGSSARWNYGGGQRRRWRWLWGIWRRSWRQLRSTSRKRRQPATKYSRCWRLGMLSFKQAMAGDNYCLRFFFQTQSWPISHSHSLLIFCQFSFAKLIISSPLNFGCRSKTWIDWPNSATGIHCPLLYFPLSGCALGKPYWTCGWAIDFVVFSEKKRKGLFFGTLESHTSKWCMVFDVFVYQKHVSVQLMYGFWLFGTQPNCFIDFLVNMFCAEKYFIRASLPA